MKFYEVSISHRRTKPQINLLCSRKLGAYIIRRILIIRIFYVILANHFAINVKQEAERH